MKALLAALIVCFCVWPITAYAGESCHLTLINASYPETVIKFVIFDTTGKSLSSGWVRSSSKDQYLRTSGPVDIKYRVFRPSTPPSTDNWKYERAHCNAKVILQ